jgi:hypothetical protein
MRVKNWYIIMKIMAKGERIMSFKIIQGDCEKLLADGHVSKTC